MNRKTLIATAAGCLALLIVAAPAEAQRGGRGGWGGGGRGYYGGGRGYYGGGWNRGYYGNGWNRGYYGGGLYLGGLGYGGYYGGSPSYADGYYSPNYYYDNGVIIDGYPSYSVSPVTQPIAGPVMTSDPTGLPANGTVAQGNGAVGRQAFYSGPAGSQAVVRVKTAGPGAQLWINGTPMGTSQNGEQVFTFHSPTPGSSYTIREAWNENGQQMTREKQVTLQPGQTVVADFTQATTTEPRRNSNEPLQNTQNNLPQNGQQQDFSTPVPLKTLVPKAPIQPFNSDAKPKSDVK